MGKVVKKIEGSASIDPSLLTAQLIFFFSISLNAAFWIVLERNRNSDKQTGFDNSFYVPV